MATRTTNLNLYKPTVGGDTDNWGGFLNNNAAYIDALFAKSSAAVTLHVNNQQIDGTSSYLFDSVKMGDDRQLQFGAAPDYWLIYDSSNTQFELNSTNVDGGGTDGVVFSVSDGTDDVAFTGKISTAQVDILAEGDLRLQDASGGQYVGFDAPATVSGSYTLTLPAAVGSSGQILRTSDSSGTLEWVTDQEGDLKSVADATNGGLTVTNGTGPDVTLALNFNDLSAAAVSVANDSIAIIDASDSNGTRKESIADLATAMGGTGLTGSSGTLNVDAAQTQITSVGALNAGSITSGFGNIDVGSSSIDGGTITADTAFVPDAADGASLGTASLEFSDLYLADGAVIRFGHDQDVSLTHVPDTGLLLGGTRQLQFYDASQRIAAVDATALSIGATDEIDLTATALDLNGNVDISGTTTLNGTLTTTAGSIFNQDGGDYDFRVEGDTEQNLLFVDASTDRVGIGTNAPDKRLHIEGATTAHATIQLEQTDASKVSTIGQGASGLNIDAAGSSNIITFNTNGSERARFFADGEFAINSTSDTGRQLTVKHDIALEASDSTNYYQVYTHTDDSFRINYNAAGNDELVIDSSGNLAILSGAKLYLDGASNTYIHESAADTIQFVVGGTSHFQVQGDGVMIPTGHNLYLDNGGDTYITEGSANVMRFYAGGAKQFEVSSTNMTIVGALSKGSGSFRIDHPLDSMKDTHDLVHSFIEGPRADLMYRGSVQLSEGTATVDLDDAATMTDGTWELLCRDPQVWVQNEDGWTQVRGAVSGSTLTITAQDGDCTDTVSWLVVAERQDEHMMDTNWTDDDGRVIVEPEKDSEPEGSESEDDGA